jgi:hypothetical protein
LNKTVVAGTETITAQGFKYRQIGTTEWQTSTDGSLTGLTCNTEYQFKAFATTASGTVEGAVLTFTTNTCPIIQPTVVTEAADPVKNHEATLHSTVTAGSEAITAQGYKYKKIAETTWTTSTDGILTGLTRNTDYEFFAFATTASTTVEGATLTFTTTDVSVDIASLRIAIYPNPATSIATVKVDNMMNEGKVYVTDLSGRLIETRTLNAGATELQLNVSTYAEGTYFVRIVSDGYSNVDKLIVKK